MCVTVRPSATRRCSTGTAKRRSRKQRHTIARDSTVLMPKISAKLKLVTSNGGAKCRWSRLNAVSVAENWRLSTRSVVNLARSQVYHTRFLSALQYTFAVMQRVARVCQRQLILVLILWPWTLTRMILIFPVRMWPIHTVKMTQLARYLGQRSFSTKVTDRSHTHTHTHTGAISQPGPLKWSVKVETFQLRYYGDSATFNANLH